MKQEATKSFNMKQEAVKSFHIGQEAIEDSLAKKPETAKSFEDLIRRLQMLFQSEEVDIDEVKSLMASYRSNPAEWANYAHFDAYKYTRNLVDSGNGKYNLMILCWPQRMKSQIHDHADAHCIMKCLSGALHEVRFRWPQQKCGSSRAEPSGMEQIADTRLDSANSVAYINDSIGLHRVENRDNDNFAVTLHLYCPPFTQCQTFDEQTGINRTVSMTFDTEPAKPTYTVRRVSSGSNLASLSAPKDMLVFERTVK